MCVKIWVGTEILVHFLEHMTGSVNLPTVQLIETGKNRIRERDTMSMEGFPFIVHIFYIRSFFLFL